MKSLLRSFVVTTFLLLGVCVGGYLSYAEGEEVAFKLKPKYLINNSNFEMISATVTEDANTFNVVGNFRTNKDFNMMYWESEDKHSHPDLKYPTIQDFTDVILEYDYTISGNAARMNEDIAPTMTIVTNDDQYYYVRLWNYVIDRPKEHMETEVGNMLGIDYLFPVSRTPGYSTGINGKIQIDFNNLYAGWEPFIEQTSEEGEVSWIPNPEWVRVPVTNIKAIQWVLVPQQYDNEGENMEYLSGSLPFEVKFSNWNVYGNQFLMNEKEYAPVGKVRISEGYDDSYNLTPERIVGDYARLGLGKIVNFYVGASHFYDKQQDQSNELTLIKEHSFNLAFENWYDSYLDQLSKIDTEVIASISMENVDAPSSWWQRTWDGNAAMTYWLPSPKLLSFTNSEVKDYYNQLVLSLADMSHKHNMTPIVQLGEPWWWYMDSLPQSPPTFYDQSTKALYQSEFGKPMHEFKSVNEPIDGQEEMLKWLGDQNGNFALMLRDTLKNAYEEGQFTVLLFIPTVTDLDYAPKMMNIVNFPVEQWKSPNLDFFMIEDYDYLIDNNMEKHRQAMTIAQRKLNYPAEKIQYLAGADSTNNDLIWKNIDQAINDGLNMNFSEVYLWAYPQVKIRGWHLPVIIDSTVSPGLQKSQSIQVHLSSDNAEQIVYTLDGREPSNIVGESYTGSPIEISEDTKLKAAVVNNNVVSNTVEFNYIFERQQYSYSPDNRLQWVTFYSDEQKYRTSYVYDLNGNQLKQNTTKVFNLWTDRNIIPVMSANVTSNGTASASSSFGENYAPYKAFDHLDIEQSWIRNGVVEFPMPRTVISYKIIPRNEITAITASPKKWTFEGFDGIQWIVLSEEDNITDWRIKVSKQFSVQNVGSYFEYRINIQENNGYSYSSIGELEMQEGDISNAPELNIIPAMNSNESLDGIAAASSEFGSSYAAYKAFDHLNSESSWITNGSIQGWLSYQFPSPKVVRTYRLLPRYDESTISSAPKNWTLEGFNGSSWQVISTETDVTGWNVSEPKTFTVQNPANFNKYRINITENNGHTWTSIGELEMFQ
jgi:hypothetical protein